MSDENQIDTHPMNYLTEKFKETGNAIYDLHPGDTVYHVAYPQKRDRFHSYVGAYDGYGTFREVVMVHEDEQGNLWNVDEEDFPGWLKTGSSQNEENFARAEYQLLRKDYERVERLRAGTGKTTKVLIILVDDSLVIAQAVEEALASRFPVMRLEKRFELVWYIHLLEYMWTAQDADFFNELSHGRDLLASWHYQNWG
jgi:hypothetical protein